MKICKKMPEGWTCTRVAGHDGPCAALKITERQKELPDFPRYRSHKEVAAFQIERCEVGGVTPPGSVRFIGQGYEATVDTEWLRKHIPTGSLHNSSFAGGYFVAYPDGYASWLPADAFESGYTEIDPDAEPT